MNQSATRGSRLHRLLRFQEHATSSWTHSPNWIARRATEVSQSQKTFLVEFVSIVLLFESSKMSKCLLGDSLFDQSEANQIKREEDWGGVSQKKSFSLRWALKTFPVEFVFFVLVESNSKKMPVMGVNHFSTNNQIDANQIKRKKDWRSIIKSINCLGALLLTRFCYELSLLPPLPSKPKQLALVTRRFRLSSDLASSHDAARFLQLIPNRLHKLHLPTGSYLLLGIIKKSYR